MARVELNDHFDRAETAAQQGAEHGLALAAEHLLGQSRPLSPIETGDLERSSAASTDGLRAAVSYSTPYATRQHEELDWHHPLRGQAKFLEQPFHDGADERQTIIAAEIRRNLR